MLNVTIKTQGPSIEDLEASLKEIPKETEHKIIELAKKVRDQMRSNIKPRREGSTGNLKNSIDYEVSQFDLDKIKVGIGKVQDLDRDAPYWYVLSYGVTRAGNKFFPPVTRGYFEGDPSNPDPSLVGQGTQKFIYRRNGRNFLYPRTFRPIEYIQKTLGWLNAHFRDYWKNGLSKVR